MVQQSTIDNLSDLNMIKKNQSLDLNLSTYKSHHEDVKKTIPHY